MGSRDEPPVIRRAVSADAHPIAALEAIVAHHAWSEASVRSTLQLATTAAWVIVLDGHIRGHLISTHLFERAEVLLVAVDPSLRRQGWGRRLLHHGQQHWAHHGVTEAWLEVRVDNAPARALYDALGWTKHSVRHRYYRDATDAVLYHCAVGD